MALSKHSMISSWMVGASDKPVVPPPAKTHAELIAAVVAFHQFAARHWFQHCQVLASKLLTFVSDAAANDPSNLRLRVSTTFVDRYLSRAFSALEQDEPTWWLTFSDVVESIDAGGAEFTQGLVDELLVATAAPLASVFPGRRSLPLARKKIPTDANGLEPCLRFYAGLRCPGGKEVCNDPTRTHKFTGRIPPDLLERYKPKGRAPTQPNTEA